MTMSTSITTFLIQTEPRAIQGGSQNIMKEMTKICINDKPVKAIAETHHSRL